MRASDLLLLPPSLAVSTFQKAPGGGGRRSEGVGGRTDGPVGGRV